MGSPRISGFGLFLFGRSAHLINAPIPDYDFGTRYSAPELLSNDGIMGGKDKRYTHEPDVYSLSMIITEACLSPERDSSKLMGSASSLPQDRRPSPATRIMMSPSWS